MTTLKSQDPGPEAPPRIFLSYRRQDTGDLVEPLVDLLRGDLGESSIFHDRSSIEVGPDWRAAIAEAITASDLAAFLVGEQWEAGLSRRDDPVRTEASIAIGADGCRTQPVLVDRAVPEDLDGPFPELFDRQAIFTGAEALLDRGSESYQGLLLAAWDALRVDRPNGTMVIGEPDEMGSLDDVVETLRRHGSAVAAGRRFPAGCHLVWLEERDDGGELPPYIVRIGEEPSPLLRSRLRALTERAARGRDIALVGAGAAGCPLR